MRRKIVQQGPTTMMVSLPAKWIQKYNLNKGDDIEIEEFDSGLMIRPEKAPLKVTMDIDSFSKLKDAKALYRAGIERVDVKCRCGTLMKEKLADVDGVKSPALVCSKCGKTTFSEEQQVEFDKRKKMNSLMDKVKVSLPKELKDKKMKIESIDSKSFRVSLE